MNIEDTPGQPLEGGRDSLIRGWELQNFSIWDGVAGIAAVLAFIGSFLPWETWAGVLNRSGTSSGGVITLILAIASLILLAIAARSDVDPELSRWLRAGVLLLGLIVAIVAIANIASTASADFKDPGGGVILVLIAGVLQTVAGGIVTFQKWNVEGTSSTIDRSAGMFAGGGMSSETVEPVTAGQVEQAEQPQAMRSDGRLLVRAGGALMVVSTLFSWLKVVGSDGFPNVAGVGPSTAGTGLAVFVLGLSLLLWEWPFGVTLGKAVGAFSMTVVYLSSVGTGSGDLGAGVWIGLVGAIGAVAGSVMMRESASQSTITLAHPLHAGVGAALAILASFWLDWVRTPNLWFDLDTDQVTDGLGRFETLNGLDTDVIYGIPILILAVLGATLIADAKWPFLVGSKRHTSTIIQVVGVAIVALAGANVLGMLMLGIFAFGSGPLVALAGGILLTNSVQRT